MDVLNPARSLLRRHHAAGWLLLASLVLPTAALAQEDVPAEPKHHAKLTLCALSYTNTPTTRFQGGLRLLVLYKGAKHEDTALELAEAYRQTDAKIVGKIGVSKVDTVEFKDEKQLKDLLSSKAYNCILIARELKADLPEILKVTRGAKVMSVTVCSRYVKNGVSFAVARVGKRLRMFVNPSSGKKVGLRFRNAILKRADLIK